jgi:hypothetical protein
MPTAEDGKRLTVVAKRLHARHNLLAAWKKGSAARFFKYKPSVTLNKLEWIEVLDLNAIFV